MLALNGSEGCELLSKDEEKEKEEVVGNLKGNGMLLPRRFKAAYSVQMESICLSYLEYRKEMQMSQH